MNKVILILIGLVLMTSCKSREEKLMDAKEMVQQRLDSITTVYHHALDKQLETGIYTSERFTYDKNMNVVVDTVGRHWVITGENCIKEREKNRQKLKEIDEELDNIKLGLN